MSSVAYHAMKGGGSRPDLNSQLALYTAHCITFHTAITTAIPSAAPLTSTAACVWCCLCMCAVCLMSRSSLWSRLPRWRSARC